MSIRLIAKPVIQQMKDEINNNLSKLNEKNIVPKLAIIQFGNRVEDTSYRKSIVKKFNSFNVICDVHNYDMNIDIDSLKNSLSVINNDKNTHGILILRPIPRHLDYDTIKDMISPIKDIDCMTSVNLENIFEGKMNSFAPCTPKAVVRMLNYYDIPLEGANIVIINRSMVVGKPLAMMLLAQNATVTICNSKTKNLEKFTKAADIIITAVGKAKYFDSKYFNEDCVVIDVGINADKNGTICGDVNYKEVENKVKAVTPVPGGVGGVTTYVLLNNLINSVFLLDKTFSVSSK